MKYSTGWIGALALGLLVGLGCSKSEDSKSDVLPDDDVTADSSLELDIAGRQDWLGWPDGTMPDGQGGDCGPRPNAGDCNECWCLADGSWTCTLVQCDVGDQGPQPDVVPDTQGPDVGVSAMAECIARHSGCGCERGCLDGYSVTVYYPGPEQELPFGVNPPQEVLDVGTLKYVCSICGCEETWQAKHDGQWVNAEGVEDFCTQLMQAQEENGAPLKEWWGGAG